MSEDVRARVPLGVEALVRLHEELREAVGSLEASTCSPAALRRGREALARVKRDLERLGWVLDAYQQGPMGTWPR